MLKGKSFVTERWDDAREGCGCARCSCLRLRDQEAPRTLAESWLTKRGWPQDHNDSTPRMKFIRTFGFAIITQAAIRLMGR